MEHIKTEDVFGVSKKHILSYFVREDVDGAFQEALKTDKQIIVYGASKQGKTALVSKYLNYEDNIVVTCSPNSSVEDIYRAILRGAEIQIQTQTQSIDSLGANIGAKAKFKAIFPFFGSADVEGSTQIASEATTQTTTETVELNLGLPQDICELLNIVKSRRVVILENFHYLSEDVQGKLAFDLRSFQELGVRFIVLGVWREKNRLAQYNGDLLDRITEVPVEPWKEDDFAEVIHIGEEKLKIHFSEKIVHHICAESFGSIGVVQELLRIICILSGVKERQRALVEINDMKYFEQAVHSKVDDYAARHMRALEDIAAGRKSTTDENALYLPYYLICAILQSDFDEIYRGIGRGTLENKIKQKHHRPDGVRPSDMSNLLYNLTQLQVDKRIIPPIFDYDRGQRTLKVIDSTFYFFLKHCNTAEILRNIPNPIHNN